MEALVKFGQEDGEVELRDIAEPTINSDQVLLKVEAVGVCGSDIHMWRARHSWQIKMPLVLGHEFCGTIAQVGDAVSSFNPVYGQGMSVAALEAMALSESLRDQRVGFPLRFFRTVSKVVDVPWTLAAGADLNYPQVEGQRARGTRFVNWYVKRLGRVSRDDEAVYCAFVRVAQLMQPPSLLFSPKIAARVLFGRARVPSASLPAPVMKQQHA